MTCVEYPFGYINNVPLILEGKKAALNSFGDVHCPYPSLYRSELYVTDELHAELINRFQQLITVLRWSIGLGRIDIMTEVSCFSQRLY